MEQFLTTILSIQIGTLAAIVYGLRMIVDMKKKIDKMYDR